MRSWTVLFAAVFLVIATGQAPPADAPAPKQDQEKAKEPAAAPKKKARPVRSGRRGGFATYMGRPIAPVMSFEGAGWLLRESRAQEEQPDRMVDALGIRPGDTVADIGAGVGYISLRLAQRVGPKGKVLATDLQPQMLQMLSANARAAGVKNIQVVRATATDPKLPAAQVDLALMVDVYHECSNPEATLKGLRNALKPGGRLVLVEFRAEDPTVPIKPEHKMTLAQVRKEIEPQGFAFKESLEFLPWQHIIIFTKTAEQTEKAKNASSPAQERGAAKAP